jgi:hypothetical protein
VGGGRQNKTELNVPKITHRHIHVYGDTKKIREFFLHRKHILFQFTTYKKLIITSIKAPLPENNYKDIKEQIFRKKI